MKQKTGRKLLSFLLTLALVLGLMPGMGLAAYAAPTETLLTTITATGKEQASYSTEGVATVSFSYSSGGSSAYLANWGWWGYGWTATVTPADGYTITKCVFYDDANRKATDSETPFVVETTEEDKTPQVNGTPILAYTSKGITKIEVYGYATPAPALDPVSYMAWNGTTLVEKTGDDACTDYTVVTADTTTFEDGKWYVMSNSVTVSSRITVTGTVNLILCDGATLTASKGITVNSGNTINIYAQIGGTGELNAGSDTSVASIGGGYRGASSGTVNIHGGKITATGGTNASGIGGALEGGNGEVNIYSGEVTARGKNYAAGIGGYSGKSGGTVNIYGGTVNASGSQYGTTGIGIGGTNPGNCVVHIYGGEVTATSEKAAAGIQGTITIDGGTVTAKGGGESCTIDCYSGETYSSNGINGTVTISGGTVTATGGNVTGEITNFGGNIYACNGIGGTVTINGGTVTATGGSHTGNFENHRGTTVKEKGFGGSLTLGTGMYLYGGTSANPESNLSNYRAGAGDYTGDRYVYMTVNNVVPHIHSFTYTADGATITATCGAANCGLTSNPTLTIVAPTMTVYQETGKSEAATLTGLQDFNTATGKSLAVTNIMYVGRDGTEYTESTTAPKNAGKYTATITLSGVKTAEGDDKSVAASVDYSIKYAVTFNTNGGSAVPQQLVEAGESATRPTDPTREGNIFGGWFADADFAQRYVFDEVTENTTVYAKWGEHRVTWTVGRFSIQDVFTGNAPAADSNTTVNLAAETLKPDGATLSWKTETDVSGDVTHTAQFSFPVTLNVNGGTINAGNVESYIYGTGATLPTDVTRAKYDFGGWYANSELTGTAVTQIGTTATGSKEYWAKWTAVYAVPATVTANNRTYDGTEKPLVTVTGEATGGEMQYALGENATTAPADNLYTTSIPAKTDAGTYYVWYKVVGDENHSDTTPASVTVTIQRRSSGGGSSTTTVTVPVTSDAAPGTVPVKASVSGTTATVTKLTDEQLAQVTTNKSGNKDADAETETNSVVIDVSGVAKDVKTATIPTETVKAVEETGSNLKVTLTDGSVEFDATAQAIITDEAKGTTIQVNLDAVKVTTLTSAQQSAVESLEVEVVLDAYVTSNGQRISDFKGGSATLSVPYTLKDGQAAQGIVVWYVASDGTRTQVDASYDGKNVVFTVPHFSNYVIAYDAAKAAACPQDTTCPISAFTDARTTAWYHDGVHWAIENSVMNGVGDGKFAPNGITTRAQVVTMLWRLEGSPAYVGMSEFSDVDNEQWYGPAIRWASAEGIVNGYDDGRFGANDAVTREQLVTILYRYAQYKKMDVSVGEDTNILSYDDAFDVSEWAIPAMQWACGSGIVNGIDKNGTLMLAPSDASTRAVVATMFWRFSK